MTFIITVDGPSGAGKGTLSRALARHYRLAFLDTGLLYRAVGMKALESGISLKDEKGLALIAQSLDSQDLVRSDLRTPAASDSSSKVGVFHEVRRALLHFQRAFVKAPPPDYQGTLLDGRDTGTVICPEADVKFFITAHAEVRAKRRLKELQEKGITSIYSSVLQDMKERDARDSQRSEAPLRVHEEALVMDTSDLDPEDVLKEAIAFIEMRLGAKKKKGHP